ncbi:MAG: DUF1634 domain-containing protein [Chloroflexi bacterium]|nr:MAG: DUF1634 domain-containing protein [Chloroflexota bacterium]
MTKSQFIKPGCFVDSHTTALVETPPNLPSHEPFSHRLKEPEIRTTRGRSFSLAGVPWEQVDLGKTISTPLVARILKIGVTLSASLILLGILLLPQTLQQISAWWLILQPHIITLGLLALIATPVLSLVGSLLTFMRERDLQYVIITSIVLAILLYSIFFLGGPPKDQLPSNAQGLDLSVQTLLLIFAGSLTAGVVGSLAGLGGGVLLVPLLTIAFHVPIELAIGASIVSVIATSSGAAIAYVRDRLTNVRIAMVLQIGTTLGALSGVFLAGLLAPNMLAIIFGVILLISIAPMIFKLREELPQGINNDRWATYFNLAGSYPDKRLGQEVRYQVRRTPAGFVLMYVAGAISGLLGIGSGSFKVLALDTLMRLPMKVSSATSNLMIGVTAAASAGIYLSRGNIVPLLAAPVALGVLLGAFIGARLLVHLSNKTLRYIFLPVLTATAIEMLLHGIGIGPF